MVDRSCGGCRFSGPIDYESVRDLRGKVLCRRRAPWASGPGDTGTNWSSGADWPVVGHDDWCGEFEYVWAQDHA
jgi:hypothetical protein